MKAIFSFSINHDGPWTSLDRLNLIAEALDHGGVQYDSMTSIDEVPGDYLVNNIVIENKKALVNNYVDFFYNNIHVTAMLPEEQNDSND